MMTPRMRDEMNAQIAAACRQLFLSSVIPEMCEKEATPKHGKVNQFFHQFGKHFFQTTVTSFSLQR